ncbi:hypothetical protein DFJ73DRAFT_778524 [Zopfochytrium polystomum]|nr:hypothetical protein DFJ73DRAFT_778524 [Zopfochytrium polystomum]
MNEHRHQLQPLPHSQPPHIGTSSSSSSFSTSSSASLSATSTNIAPSSSMGLTPHGSVSRKGNRTVSSIVSAPNPNHPRRPPAPSPVVAPVVPSLDVPANAQEASLTAESSAALLASASDILLAAGIDLSTLHPASSSSAPASSASLSASSPSSAASSSTSAKQAGRRRGRGASTLAAGTGRAASRGGGVAKRALTGSGRGARRGGLSGGVRKEGAGSAAAAGAVASIASVDVAAIAESLSRSINRSAAMADGSPYPPSSSAAATVSALEDRLDVEHNIDMGDESGNLRRHHDLHSQLRRHQAHNQDHHDHRHHLHHHHLENGVEDSTDVVANLINESVLEQHHHHAIQHLNIGVDHHPRHNPQQRSHHNNHTGHDSSHHVVQEHEHDHQVEDDPMSFNEDELLGISFDSKAFDGKDDDISVALEDSAQHQHHHAYSSTDLMMQGPLHHGPSHLRSSLHYESHQQNAHEDNVQEQTTQHDYHRESNVSLTQGQERQYTGNNPYKQQKRQPRKQQEQQFGRGAYSTQGVGVDPLSATLPSMPIPAKVQIGRRGLAPLRAGQTDISAMVAGSTGSRVGGDDADHTNSRVRAATVPPAPPPQPLSVPRAKSSSRSPPAPRRLASMPVSAQASSSNSIASRSSPPYGASTTLAGHHPEQLADPDHGFSHDHHDQHRHHHRHLDEHGTAPPPSTPPQLPPKRELSNAEKLKCLAIVISMLDVSIPSEYAVYKGLREKQNEIRILNMQQLTLERWFQNPT